ncbi:hypothetical protein AX15_004555 [Amanita polypyramis BW_CC]|nr:hypothetical protein AX15_004555 [Amanita polypyramis BW_CC]
MTDDTVAAGQLFEDDSGEEMVTVGQFSADDSGDIVPVAPEPEGESSPGPINFNGEDIEIPEVEPGSDSEEDGFTSEDEGNERGEGMT